MTNVKVDVRDGDVVRALKVFKKKVEREGVLRDLRRQAYALRAGERRRAKRAKAVRRSRKIEAGKA
jgi:small subunit ribosomal protein S21